MELRKLDSKNKARAAAREIGLSELHEWQEVVGDVTIGKGLSYQCEIEGVIEDACEKAYAQGQRDLLEAARKNAVTALKSSGTPVCILASLEQLVEGRE